MPMVQAPADPSTNASDAENSEHSDSEDNPRKRKRRLSEAIKDRSRKKKKKTPLDRYTQFAAWYNRTERLDVYWPTVFEHGMAWDSQNFGSLTRQDFSRKYGQYVRRRTASERPRPDD
ncbi:hypothetical protein CVT26_001310 [Gymnopilus dilepis]|uniref:Uncharacterized protein n=1 Tax=Gymnopilus dilepis TaxID=231916 RepID=A0A409X593_9AGAR|nr:hypothetical protein CVT26_001310 [Gymnopilus dilepis]